MGRTRADVTAVAAILVGLAGGVAGTAWVVRGLEGGGVAGVQHRCVRVEAPLIVYSAGEGRARVSVRRVAPRAPAAPTAEPEPCEPVAVRALTVGVAPGG